MYRPRHRRPFARHFATNAFSWIGDVERLAPHLKWEGEIHRLARTIVVALAGLATAAAASPADERSSGRRELSDQPRLVIQITFDQLRGDLLRRYAGAFRFGFRRVLQGGTWIRRGDVDHALTVSYPGHATLATGLYPSHHGLNANEWWIRKGDRWTEQDAADDPTVSMLGEPGRIGPSPRRLAATTIGEWLKRQDPRARAIALGTSTIAIVYGGQHPDGDYWYDSHAAGFTTSTYYANALPKWLVSFNSADLPAFKAQAWDLTVPAAQRSLALPDNTPFESDGKHNVFPHVFAVERNRVDPGEQPQSYGGWFGGTPLKDEALFALAARAVDGERLGQEGHTDYLALDVDSTDSVGHEYGPRSLEQLDTLLRLDRALGKFLEHLDSVIGPRRYVIAISADHGVADPPEQHGLHRVTKPELEALLDRVEEVAKAPHPTEAQRIADIVRELKRAPFVDDAYTERQLAEPSTDPLIRLFQKSFRAGQTPDYPLWSQRDRPYHPARYGITTSFKPGVVFDYATGVHGSPFSYDRDVPIIFYGANVPRRRMERGGRTVDVAPTLAALAGIRTPGGLDGKALPLRGPGKHR